MNINKEWAMPNANTFQIKPIKEFVEKEVYKVDTKNGGVIVDPFANTSNYGTITNDLNPNMPTKYHEDALIFLRHIETESADLVLYDPPYSVSQASEVYNSFGGEKLEYSVTNSRYWSQIKDEIARILKVGGVVLSFGWNTNGIGKDHDCEMTDILIVAHGGIHNDTLCCREVKISGNFDYSKSNLKHRKITDSSITLFDE